MEISINALVVISVPRHTLFGLVIEEISKDFFAVEIHSKGDYEGAVMECYKDRMDVIFQFEIGEEIDRETILEKGIEAINQLEAFQEEEAEIFLSH